MNYKRTLLGLVLLSLMLFGTGCTPQVRVERLLPPQDLLADCEHADAPTERTNAGLVLWLKNEQYALDVCNADKAALRAWAQEK
ncbi:hypothetical protein ACJBUE_20990 (plasmid) [Ralstonia syzygii subsp. celebesensis]|uniref:Uncharacterized protein n=1 Tax=blood disease bacterium R229 TaxID=741978 RepID=G2ZW13_9RALS|nr:hypothetical protein [Ralstonia syzygii]QQV57868.1 hypothetical protein JK151_20820 [Ralstonia syzygii subsp. celebesensis]CCA83297.1 exported hypothetical protein [blood disease bacterium R229]